MLNEPVRGTVPELGIFSVSGLERMRLFQQSRLPPTPHARLFGYRMTQISSGSVVVSQPISPWSEIADGFVDLTALAALSASVTASTAAPAGIDPRLVTLTLRYLRSLRVEDGSVIARGRVLHAGTAFTTVETLFEDPLGRAVACATASTLNVPLDQPPPAWSPPAEPAPLPVYATPDPYQRSLPTLDTSTFPAAAFLGIEVVARSDTSVSTTMAASPWFSNSHHDVEPGVIGAFGSHTANFVNAEVAGDRRAVAFQVTVSLLGPMPPADGRQLRSTARLSERVDDMFTIDDRIEDPDGGLIGTVHGTLALRERRTRQQSPSNRVLLTVLFTDIVGSTERAGTDGDLEWRHVLEEHHEIVRRQIGCTPAGR